MKHVFTITLKLDNHTWKKLQKYFFVEKMCPNHCKKTFFEKNVLLAYLCEYDFQNVVRKTFVKNGFQGIYVFVILRFWKIVLHNEIIHKTRSTKNQENSAHCFGDNYLTNHLVKFLQDRIKPWIVGGLSVSTGYNFFLKKIVSEGFLTFRVAHANNSH